MPVQIDFHQVQKSLLVQLFLDHFETVRLNRIDRKGFYSEISRRILKTEWDLLEQAANSFQKYLLFVINIVYSKGLKLLHIL